MNKKILLQALLARTALHHPDTQARMKAWVELAEKSVDDESVQAQLADLQKAALTDPQKFQELQRLRMTTVENFLTIQSNAGTFFETIELAEDEEPFLENKSKFEMKARFIGEDGPPRMSPVIQAHSRTPVPLRMLSTDDYEVPLYDLYRGRIAEDVASNLDISGDLVRKEDEELWGLVKAAVGNFQLTGKKADRTYIPGHGIAAGNLPTSNLIQLQGNNTSSTFRWDVVKAMIKWCMRWGGGVSGLGQVVPVALYIPSADSGDLLDHLEPDMPDNAIVREIQNVGYVLSLAGKSFTIVPDATLDPAEGRCYLRTNVPLGFRYTKPALAQMWPDSLANVPAEQRKRNRVLMGAMHPFGAVTPNPRRMGVLAIEYRTPQ